MKLVVLVAASACTTTHVTSELVDQRVAEGQARGADLAEVASAELQGDTPAFRNALVSDILYALDDAELRESRYALAGMSTPRMIEFSKRMIAETTDLETQLNVVRTGTGIAVRPSYTGSELRRETLASIQRMAILPTGRTFDQAYMELEVEQLAETQVVLATIAHLATTPDAFSAYLTTMRRATDDHLADAEDLLLLF